MAGVDEAPSKNTNNWDRQLIQPFKVNLRQDERILWVGRPKQGIILRPETLGLFLTLLVILLPSIWFVLFNYHDTFTILVLLGLCLIIAVLGLILPMIQDIKQRKNVSYAVTNLRVMRCINGANNQVHDIDYEDMQTIKLSKTIFASDTIICSKIPLPKTAKRWRQNKWFKQPHYSSDVIELYAIDNPQMVYELIKQYKFPFSQEAKRTG